MSMSQVFEVNTVFLPMFNTGLVNTSVVWKITESPLLPTVMDPVGACSILTTAAFFPLDTETITSKNCPMEYTLPAWELTVTWLIPKQPHSQFFSSFLFCFVFKQCTLYKWDPFVIVFLSSALSQTMFIKKQVLSSAGKKKVPKIKLLKVYWL